MKPSNGSKNTRAFTPFRPNFLHLIYKTKERLSIIMKHVDIPKPKRGSCKDLALTPKERDKLLKFLTDDTCRIILLLGAYGGLRCSEIAQCRFQWLEWEIIEGKRLLVINIPASARDTRNKYRVWQTKTKKERSSVILDEAVSNEVYFWFKNNKKGLMRSRQDLYYIVSVKFTKLLGRKTTVHALRATCQNYLLYEKNLDPKYIAIALGHVNQRTTEQYYKTMNKASAMSYLKGIIRNERQSKK